MTDASSNTSAQELWAQVLQRQSKHEYASLQDPEYDPAEDMLAFRRGMTEAGWSDKEIDEHLKMREARLAGAPATSLGVVNPHVEVHFARLADDVEAAMERLGLGSQARVARGIEPRCGPYAAKINVVMTDESVLIVGAHLFRFCGLIARAFTRTLLIDPWFWESQNWTPERAKERVVRRLDVVRYWFRIYLSYAVTGTNVLAPFKPAQKHELILFEQVARAMEIFAVAHEYGHHHADHGRSLEADAQGEEFAADQFALKISYEVERFPFITDNPYLSSGAGGAVLLLALRTLRGTADNLRGGARASADTHPDAVDRIGRFDTVAVLKPQEFVALKSFRTVAVRIMTTVEELMLELLHAAPREALSAFAPLPFDEE